MARLVIPALKSTVGGFVVLGLLLFLPAGTFNYWQAWVVIAIFVLGSIAIGLYLSIYDPELLERRKQAGPRAEPRAVQKIIILFLIAALVGMMVVCALDRRFGWSEIAAPVSLMAQLLAAIGLGITFLVLRENSFSASTIRVFKDQKVISTGPYAQVRHPMYSGMLLLVLATPVALGSWWGLLPALLAVPALVWRIVDEEKLLNAELPGYADYAGRVRSRLVPQIW